MSPTTVAPTTVAPTTHAAATTTRPGSATDLALADLAQRLTGRLLTPADDGYPALATPWNVAAASPHLAVAEVVDATDVATVLRCAADAGLEVVVQATGHGAVAQTRPTILIQTGLLDEITIDPAGSARVGAGVRWFQVLEAAAPHGLAGLAGSAPDVGVVGYTTGGGLGPVARTFGYASDRVTAFDVVTGDGVLRRATPTENPALFWALRGGKGAVGIVTSIEFTLLPLREIFGGCWYFNGTDASAVMHAWQRWSATLPEQASTSLAVLRLPAMPAVPPPLAGRVTVAVRFAWVGDPADGRRAIARMESVAPVILGGMDVLPYPAIGWIHADPVDPMPVQEHTTLLRELPAEAVDTMLAHVGTASDCPQVVVELRLLGGAIARPGEHPSAIGHRDAAFTLLTIGLGVPPFTEPTGIHAAQLFSAMAPWSDGWTIPNFGPSTDPAKVARSYDPATLARLGSLVATYDPHGVLAAARPIRSACAVDV